MYRVQRESSAITELWVYPIKGKANVMYNNGNMYEYTNVSRLSLLNVLLNDSISLGKWVNENCKKPGVKCQWTCYETPWMSSDKPELPKFV